MGCNSIVYNDLWENVLPKYPDGYFDLALCDIPYGIGVGKMAYLQTTDHTIVQKNGVRLNANRNKKPYTNKDWDNAVPSQVYFDELKRVCRNQIIFGVDYVQWAGLGAGRIIWDKCVPESVSFKGFERAYCSMIDQEITIHLLWSGMNQAKSIKEPTTQQGNKKLNEKRIHPCHKPIMLYDILLSRFGSPGMKIVDTHLGGGSSRIAADRFGAAEFVGCEIDKEYYQAQEARFSQYKSQQVCEFNYQ